METILKVECGLGYWFLKKRGEEYGGGFGDVFVGDGLHGWYSKDEMVCMIMEASSDIIPREFLPAYQEFTGLAILKLVFEEPE